jgi:hypothetical protein
VPLAGRYGNVIDAQAHHRADAQPRVLREAHHHAVAPGELLLDDPEEAPCLPDCWVPAQRPVGIHVSASRLRSEV